MCTLNMNLTFCMISYWIPITRITFTQAKHPCVEEECVSIKVCCCERSAVILERNWCSGSTFAKNESWELDQPTSWAATRTALTGSPLRENDAVALVKPWQYFLMSRGDATVLDAWECFHVTYEKLSSLDLRGLWMRMHDTRVWTECVPYARVPAHIWYKQQCQGIFMNITPVPYVPFWKKKKNSEHVCVKLRTSEDTISNLHSWVMFHLQTGLFICVAKVQLVGDW